MNRFLTDRKEIAEAMNFGKHPVLRIDLETPKAGWDDMYVGDKVRIAPKKPRWEGHVIRGTIHKFSDEPERYSIMPSSVYLKDSFGYSDVIERLAWAQAPLIHAGETVVVIEDFPNDKSCTVHMMKVSDTIGEHVFPTCYLEEIKEDE